MIGRLFTPFLPTVNDQVISWRNSLFSGKDDNYNTLEGLSHNGVGRLMRRGMTPFGSGFSGERQMMMDFIAATGKSVGANAEKFAVSVSTSEAKIAFRAMANIHHPDKGGSTEAFQQLNKMYERIKTSGQATSEQIGLGFGKPEARRYSAPWDDAEVYDSSGSTPPRSSGPVRDDAWRATNEKSKEGFRASRARYKAWASGKTQAEQAEWLKKERERKSAGKPGNAPWNDPIYDPPSSTGPSNPSFYEEQFKKAKQDFEDIFSGMPKSYQPGNGYTRGNEAEWDAYQAGVDEKMRAQEAEWARRSAERNARWKAEQEESDIRWATMRAKWAAEDARDRKRMWIGIGVVGGISVGFRAVAYAKRKFRGKDDDYNNIEGLSHKGIAQHTRHSMTEFGSGWDKLRALVNTTYKGKVSFEGFLKSSRFQKALAAGKEGIKLGEGGLGVVHLMNTQLRVGGKDIKFMYARKMMHDTDKLLGMGHSADFIATNSLAHETNVMRSLQDLNAPTVYGSTENALYMEAFPGQSAGAIMKKGGTLPKSFIDDLAAFNKEMHGRGFAHGDMGSLQETGQMLPHNVIMTKEGRAAVIDFGMSSSSHGAIGGGSSGKGITRNKFLAQQQMDRAKLTVAEFDDLLVSSLRANKGKLNTSNRNLAQDVIAGANTQRQTAITKANVIDKQRKLAMAKTQRVTVATMAENARSGGKRSKSSYAASGKSRLNDILLNHKGTATTQVL